jgi:hypothetical protein
MKSPSAARERRSTLPPREAANLIDLLKIREHSRDKIDAINGNLGSALGYKYTNGVRTDHPCIIVFVPKKIPESSLPQAQIVPKELEAPVGGDSVYCRTDVVRGGKADVPSDPPPLDAHNVEIVKELRGGARGLVGGVQIGAYDVSGRGYVGTAGCAVVEANGSVGLLTNQHVAGAPGRIIFHPEPGRDRIGITSKVLEVVTDERHYGGLIDETDALIRVDCGVVRLDKDAESAARPGLYELGELGEVMPIDTGTMDVIGAEVVSVGRTRGLQRGMVAAYAYEWSDEERWSVYTDLLIIGDQQGGAFSDHGDSGKLIVTASGNRPLALLWGGWQERLRAGYEQENWTYAIDVAKVLEYLDVRVMR